MTDMEYIDSFLKKGDISRLIKAIDHPDLFVGCSAINELGTLIDHPEIQKSVPALISVLHTRADLSNMMAVIALGKLGKVSHDQVLDETMQYGQLWLQVLHSHGAKDFMSTSLGKLFQVLGNIGNPASLPKLIPLLDALLKYQHHPYGNSEVYRLTILDGLACLGKIHDERAADFLVQIYPDLREQFKGTVIWALGQIGGEKARAKLWEIIQSSESNTHHQALASLSQELTIFISSTFQDMQADRNALMAECMPKLRVECEERGIHLSVIDLRWGITPDETSNEEDLVRACLQRINHCQNHHFIFIGLLGFRYGKECKWDKTGKFHSMTEIEILHALTSESNNKPRLSLFYLRDEENGTVDATDNSYQRALSLRERVKGFESIYTDVKVTESYRDGTQLSNMVYQDILPFIQKTFPSIPTYDPSFHGVLRQFRGYSSQLSSMYVPQPDDFQLLTTLVSTISNKPILVRGREGIGKTSLICHWAEKYSEDHTDELVIVHNLSYSKNGQEIDDLFYHLRWEYSRLAEKEWVNDVDNQANSSSSGFDLTEQKILDLNTLMSHFLDDVHSIQRVILMLDGIERGEAGLRRLDWIDSNLPDRFHLLLFSRLEEDIRASAEKYGWEITHLNQNINQDDIETIVNRTLTPYGKELTYRQLRAILSIGQIKNPLFLQVLLDYLIQYAPPTGKNESFEDHLIEKIHAFSEAGNLEDLYFILLKEDQQKYGNDFLQLLEFLSVSPTDQSEEQIFNLVREKGIELDSAAIFRLQNYLGESFNFQNAHTAFKNAYLRIANKQKKIPQIEPNRSLDSEISKEGFLPHTCALEEKAESYIDTAHTYLDKAHAVAEQYRTTTFPQEVIIDSDGKKGAKLLEKALADAVEGTVIKLAGGTYPISKTLFIKKSITLKAKENHNSGCQVIFIADKKLEHAFVADLNVPRLSDGDGYGKQLNIDGINFQGKNEKVELFTVSNAMVCFTNCTFKGFHLSENIPEQGGIGLLIKDNVQGYVHACRFEGFIADGIQTNGFCNLVVEKCQFRNNAWGILAKHDGEGCLVWECIFDKNFFGGISLKNTAKIIVIGNEITASGGNGLLIKENSTAVVLQNVVKYSLYSNIRTDNRANVILMRNQSTDSNGYGVEVFSSHPDLIIYNNKIFRNNWGGISIYKCQGIVWDNEVAYNFLIGIQFDNQAKISARNNSAHDNQQNGISVFSDQPMTIEHNHCYNNGGMGISSSTNTNPLLKKNLCEYNGMSGFYLSKENYAELNYNTSMENKEFGIQIPYGDEVRGLNLCIRNALGPVGWVDFEEYGSR